MTSYVNLSFRNHKGDCIVHPFSDKQLQCLTKREDVELDLMDRFWDFWKDLFGHPDETKRAAIGELVKEIAACADVDDQVAAFDKVRQHATCAQLVRLHIATRETGSGQQWGADFCVAGTIIGQMHERQDCPTSPEPSKLALLAAIYDLEALLYRRSEDTNLVDKAWLTALPELSGSLVAARGNSTMPEVTKAFKSFVELTAKVSKVFGLTSDAIRKAIRERSLKDVSLERFFEQMGYSNVMKVVDRVPELKRLIEGRAADTEDAA